jgi:osmotically-inducible protein OsmY
VPRPDQASQHAGRELSESSNLSADQAVLVRARRALESSPYLPLRTITCYIHEGVLSLRGRVPTFYCKQLAQSLVSAIAGVEEVNNQLEVVGPGRR